VNGPRCSAADVATEDRHWLVLLLYSLLQHQLLEKTILVCSTSCMEKERVVWTVVFDIVLIVSEVDGPFCFIGRLSARMVILQEELAPQSRGS